MGPNLLNPFGEDRHNSWSHLTWRSKETEISLVFGFHYVTAGRVL